MTAELCLEVEGPFACFTRPEMKADRVSYDVITPSAARSIFEAIYWHPGMRWQVTRIVVLAPIRWINLRRNELGRKVPVRNVIRAMERGATRVGEYIEDDRSQRSSLLLRDVRYRINSFVIGRDSAATAKAKDIFRRRALKGQCVYQPYLGCREFDCEFKLVDPESPFLIPDELLGEIDLGLMLREMDFSHEGRGTPSFFHAKMLDGIISVPASESIRING
jgi:CRISPR-associated protein Cas5d